MEAYLVLVKWPSGLEGLLFPRPGNVQLARTIEEGMRDFHKAREDLKEMHAERPRLVAGAEVRLFRFEQNDPEPIAKFIV